MRALILAAGLGTRLRPVTYVRAKAAVPVNGEPIIRRIISWVAQQGVSDVVVNLHHHPASIAAVVGDGQDLGARVRYSWEHPVLGSAGGPRHALPLLVDGVQSGSGLPDGTFLLVNGDTLTDLQLGEVVEVHRTREALVTMALTPNPHPERYGGVLVTDGYVVGFSRPGDARESFHFIGVQVAEARAFSRLPDGVPAETVTGLYPELIRENRHALACHVVDAPFHDVGTAADYLQTSLALAAVEGNRLVSASGVEIDVSAEVHRTVVWDDVTVGPDARLHDCVLCDGVRLPARSDYKRCAIIPHRGQVPRHDERLEGMLLIKEF